MSINFVGTGRIFPITKETEKFKAADVKIFKSGWCQKTLNFNFAYGSFRSLMQIQFGYWGDQNGNLLPDKNVIYTSKIIEKDGETEIEGIQVPYSDRLKPETVESIAKFRKYSIDTNKINTYAAENIIKKVENDEEISDEDKQKYNVYSLEDAKELSKKIQSARKEYICAGDFLEKARELIETPDISNKKFKIRGVWDWNYNEEKNTYYRTFRPSYIALIEDDKQKTAKEELLLNFDFTFTKGAYNDETFKENGKVILNGFTKIYDSRYKNDDCKGNLYAPISMVFTPDTVEKYEVLKKRFTILENNKYQTARVEASYVEGSERVGISIDDLPENIREEIDCGLRDLDVELRKAGGSKYGDKIIEIRYNSWSEIKDSVCTDDDMRTPTHTAREKSNKVVNQVISQNEKNDDIFSDIDI